MEALDRPPEGSAAIASSRHASSLAKPRPPLNIHHPHTTLAPACDCPRPKRRLSGQVVQTARRTRTRMSFQIPDPAIASTAAGTGLSPNFLVDPPWPPRAGLNHHRRNNGKPLRRRTQSFAIIRRHADQSIPRLGRYWMEKNASTEEDRAAAPGN